MNGKRVLVTGGSSGIGKDTALGLANMGAEVIIVGRDLLRTEKTVNEIKEKTNNTNVSYLLADLASQQSIRHLAETFKQRYSQLHILLNNAGGIYMQRQLTEDGYEMTFAVNHLAYFLLTQLLLDTLKATSHSRIINVSSDAHYRGKIDFTNLMGEKSYIGWHAYSHSKLANVLFTYELARRLKGTGVTANCLHPGVIASNFGKNNVLFGFLVKVVSPFLASTEKGAETSIYLASSSEVEGVTGKYYDKKAPTHSSGASYNATVAQKLWEVSEQMTRW